MQHCGHYGFSLSCNDHVVLIAYIFAVCRGLNLHCQAEMGIRIKPKRRSEMLEKQQLFWNVRHGTIPRLEIVSSGQIWWCLCEISERCLESSQQLIHCDLLKLVLGEGWFAGASWRVVLLHKEAEPTDSTASSLLPKEALMWICRTPLPFGDRYRYKVDTLKKEKQQTKNIKKTPTKPSHKKPPLPSKTQSLFSPPQTNAAFFWSNPV